MEPFFLKLHGAILGASLFLGTVTPTSHPPQKPAATSTKKVATSTQQKVKKVVITTEKKKDASSFVTPTAIIPQKTKDETKTKNQPSKTQSIDSYSSSDNVRSGSSFSFFSKQKPCSSPIGYKLGSFDSRFTISKQEFLTAISESSSLWSTSYGRPLFVYDEKGPLTVNLIYDTRQMSTQELNYLSLEIDNTKLTAGNLKSDYERDTLTYTTLSDEYTKDVEAYNQKTKTYADTVTSWNEKGGAPRDTYDTLTKEKETLQEESKNLEKRRGILNTMLTDINSRIKRYNELVTYLNDLIKKNNSYGTMHFTEGRYSSGSNTIDIYQFSDNTKLKRVLTHEFGHALSIDHNENKESIMYPTNTSSSTTLSKEDMESLKTACGK